jgi:hypothetical protein
MSTIIIDNLFGGISQLANFAPKGSYDSGIAIDLDMPITDVAGKPSGFIRPTAMEKFTGSTVTSAVKWIITNPKDTTIRAYGTNGLIHSISSSLSMNADIGTPTNGAGNGAAYYDNYNYYATPTDISREGPLNGTPALTNNYWNTTLGKAVLTNTTYPSINGVEMPNHVMHRHTDNKLYICDVLSNTAPNTNKGALHYITSSKTTVEGDTNASSSYNALDLGYGYYPTTIGSLGTDLVTAGIEGVSTTVAQSRSFLTFWDTTSVSFSKIIQKEFPDPLITAVQNVNGTLFVFSGSATGGCRLTAFAGGYTGQPIFYDPTMLPPLQGAVDSDGDRLVWGTTITYPEAAAVVMGYGSRYGTMGKAVHCILKSTSAGATQIVSAVKHVIQGGFRQPIVAWADASSQGIDKLSTTYGTSVFRSEVFRVGSKFNINEIRIPLAQTLGANMTITPKIIENGSTVATLPVINNTNYPSKKVILQRPSTLCENSFQLELRFTGTALCTVALPIRIEIEPRQD